MGIHELKNINSVERTILSHLMDEIRRGTAVVKDYQDYENLLISHGIPKEKIKLPLQNARINNWQEFLNKRNQVANSSDYTRKNEFEGIIVGVLLGIGLFLLLRILDKNK